MSSFQYVVVVADEPISGVPSHRIYGLFAKRGEAWRALDEAGITHAGKPVPPFVIAGVLPLRLSDALANEVKPEMGRFLAEAIVSGTQDEVARAYARAIKRWPDGTPTYGPFWREANAAIVKRWSEGALLRIKAKAWRLVEAS